MSDNVVDSIGFWASDQCKQGFGIGSSVVGLKPLADCLGHLWIVPNLGIAQRADGPGTNRGSGRQVDQMIDQSFDALWILLATYPLVPDELDRKDGCDPRFYGGLIGIGDGC